MNAYSSVVMVAVCLAVIGCSNQDAVPKIDVQQKEQPDAEEIQPPSAHSLPQTTSYRRPEPAQPLPANEAENEKVMLDIPMIKQNPELRFGCEVTSLAMVLQHAGIKTDKMKLAREMPTDPDPMQKSASGDITRWGNPHHGFVGDITGQRAGFAIYARPLEKLMRRYLPNRTVNLTDQPFDRLVSQIQDGKPVIVWTTNEYKLPDRWESWKHGNQQITAPLDLHAVVLVGYDKEHVYLNDPLTGKKAQKTAKHTFIQSWKALGHQALSYR
ncbi:C39 family peptidase [Brevibacillus migulae]|uniref:C39 family peptidase n=1 Tax=Brevibacillus migulae TaxID=1644114 RepID=UPI00106EF4BC|nr:C39 family peptidase [Brevibacillus migulae]